MADPNLWYKLMVHPVDGFEYYADVLIYVDDCIAIGHDATEMLHEIDKYFKMKPGSIRDPDIYLGAKLHQCTLPNGVHAWALSPSKYVQEAVKMVEQHLTAKGMPFKKRVTSSFLSRFVPELDVSKELDHSEAKWYQSQVGVLRWTVELGHVDRITEVLLLALHSALPRQGHLDATYHLYTHIKKKHNSRMVFDPTYPKIDVSSFLECNWKDFYGNVKEAVPLNAPKPRGKEVDTMLFVDSSHADDKLTHRSRSGYFIFVSMAPVAWLSKKQVPIESSVFGAEFVAMKHCVEHVRGLRYKLRMMGILIAAPTYVYGDNMSVIHNTKTQVDFEEEVELHLLSCYDKTRRMLHSQWNYNKS
jgi:hypothetical protein